MSPDVREIFADRWIVLKYTSLTIATLYGVFATLVDFRTEKDGQRRFSRWGYVGIAVLITSSVLGLTVEWGRDRREYAQQRAEDSERVAQAEARVREQAQAQAAQRAVLDRLNAQLDRLRSIQTVSERSLTQGGVQLRRQATLLDAQQTATFNGTRMLYPFSKIERVDAELLYRWDPAVAPNDRALGVREQVEAVRVRADSVCRELVRVVAAHPDSVDQSGSTLIVHQGGNKFWSWDRLTAAAPARLLPASVVRLFPSNVRLYGVGERTPGRCAVDSVSIAAGSDWLATEAVTWSHHQSVRVGRIALGLSLARDNAASTRPDLTVPVEVDPRSGQEHDNRAAVLVDFVHATMRKRMIGTVPSQPTADANRILSLLDLPARALTVDAGDAADVAGLTLHLAHDRRIVVPARAFKAGAGGFTYRIAVADIENEPGEFAGLFPQGARRAAR